MGIDMNRRHWHSAVLASFCGALAAGAPAQVNCDYDISPALVFGAISGLPTPQVDVTASVSVTCSSASPGNHRVCLSIPAGSGGLSVSDRRLLAGGDFVQFQLYRDAARTEVWGALGESSPPVAIDFVGLAPDVPVVEIVTVHARLFAGQTGKPVGTYQSNLSPIVARREDYAMSPPDCQSVTSNAHTLDVLPAQATIEPECMISASPLNFGTVSSLSGHGASTNLSITCTLDAAYSIALDGGTVTGDVHGRRMRLGAGPDTIDYLLYSDSGLGAIWGDTPGLLVLGTGTGLPESIPIYGWVPAQGPKPVGTYQDTVTATVSY